MILIVDMNSKKDSLGYYEFVLPIAAIAEKISTCRIIHFLEVTSQDLNQCSSVILSGTALKDITFLSHPEEFQWLKEIEKVIIAFPLFLGLVL